MKRINPTGDGQFFSRALTFPFLPPAFSQARLKEHHVIIFIDNYQSSLVYQPRTAHAASVFHGLQSLWVARYMTDQQQAVTHKITHARHDMGRVCSSVTFLFI